MYAGVRYFLNETLELRDIRIVYAPAAGIGNFGGEVDNWRWPRQCGDVSFFRAYVGKDGLPADYSPDNVRIPTASGLEASQHARWQRGIGVRCRLPRAHVIAGHLRWRSAKR